MHIEYISVHEYVKFSGNFGRWGNFGHRYISYNFLLVVNYMLVNQHFVISNFVLHISMGIRVDMTK